MDYDALWRPPRHAQIGGSIELRPNCALAFPSEHKSQPRQSGMRATPPPQRRMGACTLAFRWARPCLREHRHCRRHACSQGCRPQCRRYAVWIALLPQRQTHGAPRGYAPIYRPTAATCVLVVLLFARPCVARWNPWDSVSFDCNPSRERGTNATLAERRQHKAKNKNKINRIMCNSAGLKGRSKKCPVDRSQNQGRFS